MKDVCSSSSSVAKTPGRFHGSVPPAFVLPPRNTRVVLGGSARIEGKVCGYPEPQVTWYREGRAVIGGERCTLQRVGRGFFSLQVDGVTEEDLGQYTCQATNQGGRRQVTVTMLLEAEDSVRRTVPPSSIRSGLWSESPPKFITKPSRVFTDPGRRVRFCTKTTGRPPPRVTWSKGEAELQSSGRVRMYDMCGLHVLEINDVRPDDEGRYFCSVTNSAGTATTSSQLTVQKTKPIAVQDTEPIRVQETQPIRVQEIKPTRVQETQPIRVQDDEEHNYSTMRSFTSGSSLQEEAVPLDQGAAQGSEVTSTRPGEEEEEEEEGAPRFLTALTDMKVMDGSSVAMTLDLTGAPPTEVQWLHDGEEVEESEDFLLLREENRCSLLIQEVFPEDSGTYVCRAWNQHGETRNQACLTVEEPQHGVQPWFISRPGSVNSSPGLHVLISCSVSGDPFPRVSWTHNGSVLILSPGGEYQLLQREEVVSLLIRKVQNHHAGEYRIHLRNSVGECSAAARLTLTEGHPDSPVAGGAGGGGAAAGGGSRGGARGGAGGGVSQQEANQKPNRQLLHLHQEEGEEEEEELQGLAPAPRGLLRRCVDTRERSEQELRQKEAQQLNFRQLLGRRGLHTKKLPIREVQEEHRREQEHQEEQEHQRKQDEQEEQQHNLFFMDFKANLKGVRAKLEEKTNSPQQVDFRSVLGKKGPAASPGANGAKTNPTGANGAKSAPAGATEPGAKNSTDFRSLLSNKKKAAGPEKNGEAGKTVNNCVDGGSHQKPGGAAGGAAGAGGGAAPEFVEKLSDVTVVDGQRLRLTCSLAEAAGVTVTWTLDGKLIKPSKFIVLANEGGLCSLTIGKALPEDEGQYKCIAESSAGRAESCCMVLVDDPSENSLADKKSKKATPTSESEARIKKPTAKTPPKQALPPQILQFPEDMKILAGEKVEILCKFSGAPPINCTWLKFRKPIQEGSADISIESSDNSSKLTIGSGQQEHCGCYTIELRNSYGLRQAALNLTIVDKPDPPAKVPAASDIRRSSLTLSWYGPTYDGGSAVQSYQLEIWNSVEPTWKHLVSCNSTSYNIQNLLPERQYKFRVRAENIYGVGEPSVESEEVTVGLVDDETQDEAEEEEEDTEKEPEYRDVTIRTDTKVKELYDVEERLGTGKFGQVFKLVEKSTKKVWAGKFIKAYSAKDKENVRHEIGIMNSLHHPKLVQCVDAFEGKSDIVMVLEMISGGELFERIIDEDFELTEREVIKYMLQIIDGVSFIHQQGIVHLDLKPENIMCVNKTGSKIKLIDFGLARRLENAGTLKVLFGTPEFVAPEVINYEAISYPTDMWSIGVICYILLSGLSPFMGDNDNETLSNVTSATWDFEDDAFDEISENGKDFITNLLKKDMKARLTCAQCYQHTWLKQDTNTMKAKKLSKERMKKYILRRKWQKTGHAVRAIGRLSSMAMMAGVSAKKGSPTEEDNQFLECLEYEQRTDCKPTFSSVIKDVEVVEGSAARFDCKIEGYPDPEVVWYKDEQPIKETRHFQIDYDEDGNCSLVISEVSGDDDAKYMVKAVNSLGEATCTADLLVEVMAGEEEEEEEEE